RSPDPAPRPEVCPPSHRIAWLSRGKGYGHAAKDLRIVHGLRRLRPDVEVVVASAGLGLAYYRDRGEACHDLGIDDDDDGQGAEAYVRLLWFLRRLGRIDLLVADEFFIAPRLGAALAVPSLVLSHWFFSEIGAPQADIYFEGAAAIVMLDSPSAHTPPAGL